MQKRRTIGLEKRSVEFLSAYSERVRSKLPEIGEYLYTVFIIAVGISVLWVGLIFTNSTGIADVRQSLHASLGSLSVFFGGEPPVAVAEAVSASGQVMPLGELDVKSGVSGRVTMLVQQGAEVAEGDVIARLDDTSARATLRSAEAALASAEHALQEAQRSGTSESPTMSQQDSDKAFVALSDVHVNLAWMLPSLESALFDTDVKESRGNAYAYADFVSPGYPEINTQRDVVLEEARGVRNRYNSLLEKYRAVSRTSPPSEIKVVIDETYAVLQDTASALKKAGDFLAVVEEKAEDQGQSSIPLLSEHQGDIADAQVTTNDSIEQLMSSMEGLASAPQSPTDIRSFELAVADAQNDVAAARLALEKYTVYAPISGTADLSDARQGGQVVNDEILATIMSEETVARISLSEADVSKVEEGDMATISFDGVEGLSLSGTVLAVDPAATVSDGDVIFYAILGFDASDERVRPGMTVTASIQK